MSILRVDINHRYKIKRIEMNMCMWYKQINRIKRGINHFIHVIIMGKAAKGSKSEVRSKLV